MEMSANVHELREFDMRDPLLTSQQLRTRSRADEKHWFLPRALRWQTSERSSAHPACRSSRPEDRRDEHDTSSCSPTKYPGDVEERDDSGQLLRVEFLLQHSLEGRQNVSLLPDSLSA